MRVTILGCGASGGVPRIGDDWGECDRNEPRNRRRRASILVEQGSSRLLVDTSPDLRQQCLDAGVAGFDAVIFTHDHADHTHGIDELRPIVGRSRRAMPVYGHQNALDSITARFSYALGDGLYPPIVAPQPVEGPFRVGEIPVLPFDQDHGGLTSLGLRFGPIAYSTDLVGLDERAFAALEGVEIWIVDALRYEPHPTHAHVALSLEWIARIRPRRAVITHMTAELDYRRLAAELPGGVEPAYDGLVIEA